MTWSVTCRNQIVTNHALVGLGHNEVAEVLRERGEHGASAARAVFDDEAVAVEFADRMASTFPEDEVALWRLEQRAEATPWPGRRRYGDRRYVDHFCAAASDGERVEVDSRVDPIRALLDEMSRTVTGRFVAGAEEPEILPQVIVCLGRRVQAAVRRARRRHLATAHLATGRVEHRLLRRLRRVGRAVAHPDPGRVRRLRPRHRTGTPGWWATRAVCLRDMRRDGPAPGSVGAVGRDDPPSQRFEPPAQRRGDPRTVRGRAASRAGARSRGTRVVTGRAIRPEARARARLLEWSSEARVAGREDASSVEAALAPERILRDLRVKLAEMALHHDTGDPHDEGYTLALDEVTAWLDERAGA